MTNYKWKDVVGEGDTLLEALRDELNKSRNTEYTHIGEFMRERYDADVEYNLGKDGDDDYKEYCDAYGVKVPEKQDATPVCPNCHHKLTSRYEWAEERANSVYETDWEKELGYSFDNPKDNEEVARVFKLDPEPIMAEDDELGWIDYCEYVAELI